MTEKELLVPLYLRNGQAVTSRTNHTVFQNGDAAALAASYSNAGADAILICDLSEGDQEHEQNLGTIRNMTRAVDIPLYGGGHILRMEDVKKLIYAGCRKVVLDYASEGNVELTREVSDRFGREKMIAQAGGQAELALAQKNESLLGGLLLIDAASVEGLLADGAAAFDSVYVTAPAGQAEALLDNAGIVTGIACSEFMDPEFDFMELKHSLRSAGIPVNTYESSLTWAEIRTGCDGLLPVVVQDYRTQEVLMVAYMNQEAFEKTVRSGRMTYWSRSRQELWVKGLTSGHFQYVKELAIDCDNDTLLAKVAQVGAACHTGNRSCFYRSILKKEYDETNPLKVFEDVYAVIEDRKIHPKEGSYTNYLFDKGIDKILKKVGEEATEIVIAAKNPDPEEIKYEISDFLYHVMVLMAQKGVTWSDITEELARR
jgi:phosphoribosyl-ATP pyrophosphohydrolase/phosphoribosyl-AMP cyclohydrolase